jgi:adenylosuccinate synthase
MWGPEARSEILIEEYAEAPGGARTVMYLDKSRMEINDPEADPADADALVEAGGEYGTTTGRRRRCGWFDAVAARYAARLNSLSEVVVTKLDVLSRRPFIKVCVAYEHDGVRYDSFPPHQTIFNKCRPVYEELSGWDDDIAGARSLDELPAEARAYLLAIEDALGAPVSWASVGPEREQIVRVHASRWAA